jgi:predicted alpha/beta hydrolase family esterase
MVVGMHGSIRRPWLHFAITLLISSVSLAQATRPDPPDNTVLARVAQDGPLLLHLPGIGGPRSCDQHLLSGLRFGGIGVANMVLYDWTDNQPGIHALQAYDQNHDEAHKIAELLAAHASVDPDSTIYLTAHSGGCAMAVWALEQLPPNVKVQSVLLLAPALSPEYDLSNALRHVNDKMIVFTSKLDTIVLFTGTKLFGTMDGQRVPAAGFGGFVMPPGADSAQYRKIHQYPYRHSWEQYGDYGEHIGATAPLFAQWVIAPLMLDRSTPATQPAEKADGEGS